MSSSISSSVHVHCVGANVERSLALCRTATFRALVSLLSYRTMACRFRSPDASSSAEFRSAVDGSFFFLPSFLALAAAAARAALSRRAMLVVADTLESMRLLRLERKLEIR